MKLRVATPDDVLKLVELYQLAAGDIGEEPVYLDSRKLRLRLESPHRLWIVAERPDGRIAACVHSLRENQNRVCKIYRMYAAPDLAAPDDLLKECISFLLAHIHEQQLGIDVVYCTHRSLTPSNQALTLELGFKALGIFPRVPGDTPGQINGLTAYYYPGALEKRAYPRLMLHPATTQLFELVKRGCGLPDVAVPPPVSETPSWPQALPVLEAIQAPAFVARRFERLRQRKFISGEFYPFHDPNVLVTDPDQQIEVFMNFLPELGMATVIAERLDAAINPAHLYAKLCDLVRKAGMNYIELLSDATDVAMIDYAIQAGFLPSGYFPAFREHADTRRDYVILTRTFERDPVRVPSNQEHYRDFWNEYARLEANLYLGI